MDKDASIDAFIFVPQKMNTCFLRQIKSIDLIGTQVVSIQRKYVSEINLINLL